MVYYNDGIKWPKWGFDSTSFYRRLEAMKMPAYKADNEYYVRWRQMATIIANVTNMLQSHQLFTIAHRFKLRAPVGYHQSTQKLSDAISEAENNYTMFLLSH